MQKAAQQMAIRMALDWAVSALRKLVGLLEDMNEQDVADQVDKLRKQLKTTVENRDKGNGNTPDR